VTRVQVPAIVAAGDGRASRAVYGDNKAYLELAGRSLVAHAVAALQQVPEVSEVWVVGNAPRLEAVLRRDLEGRLSKPLTVVPQFRNLLENVWETYRRLLPGAGPAGRDPEEGESDLPVLYLSSDIPLASPQEISAFIRQGAELDCDYALGLVTEESMAPFYPQPAGQGAAGQEPKPGIEMAYFNLAEGRVRQSNLHLVRPPRLGKRQYIQEMYENRYQKQLGNALHLAWTIVSDEGGGVRVLFYYTLMHLAGVFDRHGWRRVADATRRLLPIARVERAVSALLDTRFRFVVTEGGGCAVDVDNDRDYDVMRERFDEWRESHARAVEVRYGPPALPAEAATLHVQLWSDRSSPDAGEEGS
jgi:hypothetical protein